jgi:hypothetical protein
MHCQFYRTEKRRVRRVIKGQLSIGVLPGTKKGIGITIQFLQDTGISTKNWQQEELNEENGGGKRGGEEGEAEEPQ